MTDTPYTLPVALQRYAEVFTDNFDLIPLRVLDSYRLPEDDVASPLLHLSITSVAVGPAAFPATIGFTLVLTWAGTPVGSAQVALQLWTAVYETGADDLEMEYVGWSEDSRGHRWVLSWSVATELDHGFAPEVDLIPIRTITVSGKVNNQPFEPFEVTGDA